MLAASGDWGKVTENPSSDSRNALDSTPNIILNTNMFGAVVFTPQNLTIAGGAAGFGPYEVQVALARVRPGEQALWGRVGGGVGGANESRGLAKRVHSQLQSSTCAGNSWHVKTGWAACHAF